LIRKKLNDRAFAFENKKIKDYILHNKRIKRQIKILAFSIKEQKIMKGTQLKKIMIEINNYILSLKLTIMRLR